MNVVDKLGANFSAHLLGEPEPFDLSREAITDDDIARFSILVINSVGRCAGRGVAAQVMFELSHEVWQRG